MASPLTLFGFGPSVYTRAVRIALIEMGLVADYVEVNPFAEIPDPTLADVTSFDRVPVIRHGAFTLTETAAILRYLDDLSATHSFVPRDAQPAARMAQVMGIVDADVYWPLVRQVYAHGAFRPAMGLDGDPEMVAAGLAKAKAPLAALDQIASEGLVLSCQELTLADFHLLPMIAAFAQVDAARALLENYPALSEWWACWQRRPNLLATAPQT